MGFTAILVLIIIVGFVLIRRKIRNNNRWIIPDEPFPAQWRIILAGHVAFYNALSDEEKSWFEYRVQEFLVNCRITGIQTTVDATNKLLVASSAVIPIFEFENWRYSNIYEVLLYPSKFSEKFEIEGDDRNI